MPMENPLCKPQSPDHDPFGRAPWLCIGMDIGVHIWWKIYG